MEINIVFLTGLVSIVTQYCAVVLSAICIVDFFSYKTRKILSITLLYLFLLPVIFTAVSISLFHGHSNDMLLQVSSLSYHNLTAASTSHLFFGFLVIGVYSRDILSKTKSLVTRGRRA